MANLSDHAHNIFSQFGEDGIIDKIFDTIGASSKVCIEFGAWDGLYLSNTANLWKKGWTGILIEADKAKYDELVRNTDGYDCHCIHARVHWTGSDTLENILQRRRLIGEVDLLSIDVDGDDYYIFKSLTAVRPRVIICEYNPTIPVNLELVPDPGGYFGCSALSLVKLAETKGYNLVALTESNCVFVQDKDFASFSNYETSLEALGLTKHLTYLMTGYDGAYVASGVPTYGCTGPSKEKFTGQYFSFPTPADSTVPRRPEQSSVRGRFIEGLMEWSCRLVGTAVSKAKAALSTLF
jgi:hypothetical protein